jgi:uncharacterized protein YbjT (DUF2867 family)
MPHTALLLGATGLVGGHVLAALLADDAYTSIVTLGRRPLAHTHPKLTHHVIDFDRLDAVAGVIRGDDVFCCLGTTIGQAGSQEAFRKVDYVYPVEIARRAHANGSAQWLMVSALGANARSPIFYNRVKAEAEAAVRALPFRGVYLFRPSLLTGNRREARKGEQMAEVVLNACSFLLHGPLRKYRAIAGATVAKALVNVAKAQPGGVQVYESDAIARIGIPPS